MLELYQAALQAQIELVSKVIGGWLYQEPIAMTL